VAIDRKSLRLRLDNRRVTKRGDDRNVRHGSDRASGCRLICNNDRRRALDRNHLTARDALGRALLRRTRQHGKEQRRKQRM
jgi:hypothetical protein